MLNVLYSLIQKSKIHEYIGAVQEGKSQEEIEYFSRYQTWALTDHPPISNIVGKYGALPLYRLLGYFSILGLLRVHTMLGDFTLALKSMENVELNQKVLTHHLFFGRPHLTLMDRSQVFTHPGDRMPRLDLLLRGILLHDAQAVHRCDAHVRNYSEPHPSHATIPHTKLSIRPNQQNCGQDVRPVRDLQRPIS